MSLTYRMRVMEKLLPPEILMKILMYVREDFKDSIRKFTPKIAYILVVKFECSARVKNIVYDRGVAESLYAGKCGALISRDDFEEIQAARKQIWKQRVKSVHVMYSKTETGGRVRWVKHF